VSTQYPEKNPFGREESAHVATSSGSCLKWLLGIGAAGLLLCGGGGVAFLVYVGAVSPDTSVYLGKQVPKPYVETARELGALEAAEQPKFFYSDGFLGIKEGFYLVTDSKVAIYSDDGRDPALTVIPFDQIASAEIERDESFIGDSYIMLETIDGEYQAFPVSSEQGRDVLFFKAIEGNITSVEAEETTEEILNSGE
jgi:hypothetical protein